MKKLDPISDFLKTWDKDPGDVKKAFSKLQHKLTIMENSRITFISRPGISHSLRASIRTGEHDNNRLFALVDIIDDNPTERWLSVCFYEDSITDEEELGNLIPKGILGEDGHCFDVFEYDETLLLYLEKKIKEAYQNVLKAQETDRL
ncbi:hypothetical protein ACFL7M_10670 [Thermodesulfobacteriota bacterium]